eukprot:scaffold7420_cov97-Isochrysis_galbana.AAC.6
MAVGEQGAAPAVTAGGIIRDQHQGKGKSAGVRVGGGKQRGVGALCCLWKDELGRARRDGMARRRREREAWHGLVRVVA